MKRNLSSKLLNQAGISPLMPVDFGTLDNATVYKLVEFRKNFPELDYVAEKCFTGPFYEGTSHHAESWPIELRGKNPLEIMEIHHGRKFIRRPHILNVWPRTWDGAISACMLNNAVKEINCDAENGLVRRIVYMAQVWIARNDGSIYALNATPGFESRIISLGKKPRIVIMHGSTIGNALSAEIAKLPYGVKIERIYVSEFWLMYDRHQLEENPTHALRITAFKPPKNEDWLMPQSSPNDTSQE